jgi:hypothetical protein
MSFMTGHIKRTQSSARDSGTATYLMPDVGDLYDVFISGEWPLDDERRC